MTLEMLIIKGLVSTSFEVVNPIKFKSITLSELAKMPVNRITKRLNVVVDKPDWIAVSQDEDEKDLVFSGKDEKVFIWNKTLTELVTQQLINDQLATIKIEKYGKKNKEEKNMAQDLDFGKIDFEGMGELPSMNAFGDAAPGGEISGATQLDHNLHNFAQRVGRFVAPITKEEAIVKVSVMKRPKMGADGSYVIAEDADTEKVRKAKESGKIPASIAVKESYLGFKESKPALAGALISIPEALIEGDSAPIDAAIAGTLKFDDSIKSSKVILMGKEEAFTVINVMFGGRIREDERVTKHPAWLQVRTTESTKVNKETGNTSIKLNSSLIVENKERKSVITEDNYIPLKLYKKISTQNPTAEEAEKMNLNIEAAIKTKDNYDKLVEDSRADITWDDAAKHKATSVYFVPGKAGKAIEVKRFFDKDQVLPNVQIPARDKKPGTTQDGAPKVTYVFETYKVEDVENGTFSKPEYRDLVEKVGMSVEDFIKNAKLTLQTRTSKSKGKGKGVELSDYMAILATRNRSGEYDTKGAMTVDFNTVNRRLKGLL